MKLKNVKFLLCGMLTAMFLIRNLQDSQFAMSFFFAIVSWQCCRAAFDAKGFEDEREKQIMQEAAARQVYGPLAGVAWALPYAVLALCAVIGMAKPELRMSAVGVFIVAVVIHSILQVVIWNKMSRAKKEQA